MGGGERAEAAQSDGTRGTPHVSELEELPDARLLFCGAHALHLLIQLLAHLRHHLLAGGPLDGAGQLGGLTEEELLRERAAEAVEIAQEGRVGVVTCGGEVAALEVAQAAEEHQKEVARVLEPLVPDVEVGVRGVVVERVAEGARAVGVPRGQRGRHTEVDGRQRGIASAQQIQRVPAELVRHELRRGQFIGLDRRQATLIRRVQVLGVAVLLLAGGRHVQQHLRVLLDHVLDLLDPGEQRRPHQRLRPRVEGGPHRGRRLLHRVLGHLEGLAHRDGDRQRRLLLRLVLLLHGDALPVDVVQRVLLPAAQDESPDAVLVLLPLLLLVLNRLRDDVPGLLQRLLCLPLLLVQLRLPLLLVLRLDLRPLQLPLVVHVGLQPRLGLAVLAQDLGLLLVVGLAALGVLRQVVLALLLHLEQAALLLEGLAGLVRGQLLLEPLLLDGQLLLVGLDLVLHLLLHVFLVLLLLAVQSHAQVLLLLLDALLVVRELRGEVARGVDLHRRAIRGRQLGQLVEVLDAQRVARLPGLDVALDAQLLPLPRLLLLEHRLQVLDLVLHPLLELRLLLRLLLLVHVLPLGNRVPAVHGLLLDRQLGLLVAGLQVLLQPLQPPLLLLLHLLLQLLLLLLVPLLRQRPGHLGLVLPLRHRLRHRLLLRVAPRAALELLLRLHLLGLEPVPLVLLRLLDLLLPLRLLLLDPLLQLEVLLAPLRVHLPLQVLHLLLVGRQHQLQLLPLQLLGLLLLLLPQRVQSGGLLGLDLALLPHRLGPRLLLQLLLLPPRLLLLLLLQHLLLLLVLLLQPLLGLVEVAGEPQLRQQLLQRHHAGLRCGRAGAGLQLLQHLLVVLQVRLRDGGELVLDRLLLLAPPLLQAAARRLPLLADLFLHLLLVLRLLRLELLQNLRPLLLAQRRGVLRLLLLEPLLQLLLLLLLHLLELGLLVLLQLLLGGLRLLRKLLVKLPAGLLGLLPPLRPLLLDLLLRRGPLRLELGRRGDVPLVRRLLVLLHDLLELVDLDLLVLQLLLLLLVLPGPQLRLLLQPLLLQPGPGLRLLGRLRRGKIGVHPRHVLLELLLQLRLHLLRRRLRQLRLQVALGHLLPALVLVVELHVQHLVLDALGLVELPHQDLLLGGLLGLLPLDAVGQLAGQQRLLLADVLVL
mmetsp:Transcript_16569/g.29017  ORF Transcript_16569/g.29017 Transcript_16569/m.29017 type:complete len:1147 (-) Transcript_16569:31-3471(-)